MALDKETIEAELTKWNRLLTITKKAQHMLYLALPIVVNGELNGLPIDFTTAQKQAILDRYATYKQSAKDRAGDL